MLKDQMTSRLAGIILQHVRNPKGRLTEISDLSRINRREFTTRGLSKMKLHRLARIIYALAVTLRYEEYRQMMRDLDETFESYSDRYDYLLLDE